MADLQPMWASFIPLSFQCGPSTGNISLPRSLSEMSLESPPQTYWIRICVLTRSICPFRCTAWLAHVAYEEHWLTLTHVPHLAPQNLGAQHCWESATPSRKTRLPWWRWRVQGGHLKDDSWVLGGGPPEKVTLARGSKVLPQHWETQASGSLPPFLWDRPLGLLTGKRSSLMTKRIVRFWSLCKFPQFVIVLSL